MLYLPSIATHVLTPNPGGFLLKNLRRSVTWSKSQRAFATAISAKHSEDIIQEWSKICEAFDEDPTKPNPYEEPKTHQSATVFDSNLR